MAVRVRCLLSCCGTVWCDVLAREYRGFESLVLCSSINIVVAAVSVCIKIPSNP